MIEFGRILCPVDFSEFSQRTVDHAVALAAWYKAQLTLLYVFVNRATMDVPPLELLPLERDRIADDMRALVGSPPESVKVDYRVREAIDVRAEILRQVDDLGADLVVMGSHGRSGFETLLLGSAAESVVRKAPCPVMVVPRRAGDADPREPVRYGRILCPVDFSEGSCKALRLALGLAQEASAHLTVLHSIERPPELGEFTSAADAVEVDRIRAAAEAACLQRLRSLIPAEARSYCTIETQVRQGPAYREILAVAAAERTDLIVMGVQGRGAFNLMVFGSNTARVMRGASCPVLTVRL